MASTIVHARVLATRTRICGMWTPLSPDGVGEGVTPIAEIAVSSDLRV